MDLKESKKCEICHNEFRIKNGAFVKHLKLEHGLSLSQYIRKYKYNGNPPKCQCGFCNEDAPFNKGDYVMGGILTQHKKFDWLKEQWILKYGEPKCPTCGKSITSWWRGKPVKYCNIKCRPSTWNQEKINKTVKEKYGVDNVFQLDMVIDDIKDKCKDKRNEMVNKAKITTNLLYTKDELINKSKLGMLTKHGVDNSFKMLKNRISTSKRMKENNPIFNPSYMYKTKYFKDSNLYYQSSYELDFLELCENKGVLDKIKNGNVYKHQNNTQILTDFSFDNYEIEIKSSYILKRQGGMKVLNEKRKIVEQNGKQYIFILDKDYREFLSILK